MTQITSIPSGFAPTDQSRGGAGQSALPGETLPIEKLHRRLRGRYVFALLMGIVCAAAAGYLGYNRRQPVYQSTGLIRIEPVLPRILYSTEQSHLMPMFERFVNSQILTIRSDAVVDRATHQQAWADAGRGATSADRAGLMRGMDVKHIGGTDLVEINVKDVDPVAAKAGVESVLDAYLAVKRLQDQQQESTRLNVLRDRLTTLVAEERGIDRSISDIVAKYGSENLGELHDAQRELAKRLEFLLIETQWLKTVAERDHEMSQSREPSLAKISAVDDVMEEHMRQWRNKRNLVEQLAVTHKAGHPELERERKRLHALEESMREYARKYVESLPEDEVDRPWTVEGVPERVTLQELDVRMEQLQERYSTAHTFATELGQKNLELRELKARMTEAKRKVAETRRRLEELSVESAVGGRIKVISRGALPTAPSDDPRLKLAVMGGGVGFMGGFALVGLVGFIDRRFRHSRDTEGVIRSMPLLGIMPSMPPRTDRDVAAMSVHCVHQIRTRLQLGDSESGGRVIAITSPASGDGKTSLSVALAWSFAVSNVRALMVDFDIVGGSMSRQFHAQVRKKLGQVMIEQGTLTEHQCDVALRRGAEDGTRFGETIIGLNLATHEAVERALKAQQSSSPGLLEVMQGDCDLSQAIHETRHPGLEILPRGAASSKHVGQFGISYVRDLFETLRSHYDVIIVDTGPTPDSLESSLVATEADAVVLAVSRGGQRPLAQRAIEHLHGIEAPIAGVVFNRATLGDIESYSRSSTWSTTMSDDGTRPPRRRQSRSRSRSRSRGRSRDHHTKGFGPISHAIDALGGHAEAHARPFKSRRAPAASPGPRMPRAAIEYENSAERDERPAGLVYEAMQRDQRERRDHAPVNVEDPAELAQYDTAMTSWTPIYPDGVAGSAEHESQADAGPEAVPPVVEVDGDDTTSVPLADPPSRTVALPHDESSGDWQVGHAHESLPNLVAAETPGHWLPASGYAWTDAPAVRWQPGMRHRSAPFIAGPEEGQWLSFES